MSKNNHHVDDNHYMNPMETFGYGKKYCQFYNLPIDDIVVQKLKNSTTLI